MGGYLIVVRPFEEPQPNTRGRGWEAGMKKKGTHHIVNSLKHAIRFSILLRGVRARKTHTNTILITKVLKLVIAILTPVFTLKFFDVNVEVILDKSTKMNKFRVTTRFGT